MRRSRYAMTLIEVMVGVFLSSLVLGAGYQIFNTSQRKMSKAATRQSLANEIRNSIKVLAQDIKAIKMDSLVVTPSASGNSAKIEFKRYQVFEGADESQLAFDRVNEVTYEFNKPFLVRKVTGGKTRTLAKNVESLSFSRLEEAPERVPGSPVSYDEGWKARMDIELSGTRNIPGSKEVASHTERVSVFMLEEYYKLINKGRYLSISQLVKDDGAKIDAEEFSLDSMFSTDLDPDELAKLTEEQLRNLKDKEDAGLTEANTRLDEIDELMGAVDASGDRTWYTLWIGKESTPVSKIQDDLKKHNKVEDLEKDLTALEKIIGDYEEENMRESFSGVNLDGISKDSQEYKDLQEAYDTMIRDRTMRRAHELGQEDLPDDQKTEYVSVIDTFNPASLSQGQTTDADGNSVSFEESNEEFQARREKAQTLYENTQKVNLGWMDAKEGEDRVKLYSAAKDLKDFAESKINYTKSKNSHEKNIGLIDDALDKV